MQIKFFKKSDRQESKDLTIVISECPSCKKESGGEVCMHCGERLYPKRITFGRLIRDVPDVFFDVDSGLFYTIRTFLTRPGIEIKKYFLGDRVRHYKPLKFVLFIGGVTTYLYAKYKITNGKPEDPVIEFGNQWQSLIFLLMVPMIAGVTWLLFKRQKNTYGEHLVANSYLIAEVSLLNILLFPVKYLFNGTNYVAVIDMIYLIFILGYYSFAFYDWFYHRKGKQGIILSFVLVLMLLIVVGIITLIMQAFLYYIFYYMGWT